MEESHSGGECERKGGKREKVEWRGAGRQDRGLQNRTTTENPLSPGLYPTTPLAQARPGPFSPLHTPPLLPFLSISSHIETNCTHYLLKWMKNTGEMAPARYSSGVNNGQLGANLQTLS